MAGGAYNLTGGVPITKHKANRSNIEMAENEENAARPFQKFPMTIYKPGGLQKQVEDEDALAGALAKGWYDDIRKVPDLEQADPDHVSGMTVAQAEKAIAAAVAAGDVVRLAEIEADERAHGNRAKVITLIEDAKDAIKPAKRGRK